MIDLDAARNGDVDALDLIAEIERLRAYNERLEGAEQRYEDTKGELRQLRDQNEKARMYAYPSRDELRAARDNLRRLVRDLLAAMTSVEWSGCHGSTHDSGCTWCNAEPTFRSLEQVREHEADCPVVVLRDRAAALGVTL